MAEPLSVDARVLSWPTPSEIRGGRSALGQIFREGLRKQSLHHARHSSLHLDTTLYQNDKREKPGNLQAKQGSVGCRKARDKNYFHMFKTSENSGRLRLLAVNFTTTHLNNKLPLRNIIS